MKELPADRVEQVALAWLFVCKAPKKSDLEKVLAPLTGQRLKAVAVSSSQVLAHLKSQGLIKPRSKMLLNDAGKERARVALQAFGVESMPSKADWAWVKRWILLRQLGLPMTSAAHRRMGTSDWLAASFLCARHGIVIKGEPTLKRVGQALAWRALGGDDASAFTVDIAFSSFLSRGLPGPIKAPTATGQDMAPHDDAPEHARPSQETAPATPISPDASSSLVSDDLGAFSTIVMSAARHSPTGRWHDKKVFISHVWHAVCRRGKAGSSTFGAFQKRLVDAHRAQQLTLSRADLVEAMPPADVKASETAYLDSTFHFVRIDDG